MATVKEIIELAESKMHKTTDVLRVDLASVRAGRATPALLEKVMVDYYGTPTPVNQVASVTVPEPRMIIIQPWEKNLLKDIERAIMKSDLGLNPNSDGAVIRLNLPQLTEERRKEIVKTVHKKSEDARVIVRNLRRDANDAVKKAEKAKEITEDEAKKGTDDIQKMTDKIIKEIDNIMLIPDVLALPLAEAIARLETAEIGYTVADTQPPRRQNEVVAEKIAVEYVVRQSLLSDNKVALVTVKKYRKEVLENGISNQ